jgi:hypothetical protein
MAPAGPAAEQNCPGTTFVHPDFDMIVQLRRSAGWAGQRGALIGEAVDQHVYDRARNFLRKRHKVQGRGTGHTVSKLAAIAIPTRYLGVWVRTVASGARGGNNRTHCFRDHARAVAIPLDRRHTEFILPAARLKRAFRRVFLPNLLAIAEEVIR